MAQNSLFHNGSLAFWQRQQVRNVAEHPVWRSARVARRALVTFLVPMPVVRTQTLGGTSGTIVTFESTTHE